MENKDGNVRTAFTFFTIPILSKVIILKLNNFVWLYTWIVWDFLESKESQRSLIRLFWVRRTWTDSISIR